jgi:hypothetical protein
MFINHLLKVARNTVKEFGQEIWLQISFHVHVPSEIKVDDMTKC